MQNISESDQSLKSAPLEPVVIEQEMKEAAPKIEFGQTALAANLSGSFHKTVGAMKRGFGKIISDEGLESSGQDEEILGKLHKFVGSLRGVREAAELKLAAKRAESRKILLNHGGKLLDGATACVEDVKNLLLK